MEVLSAVIDGLPVHFFVKSEETVPYNIREVSMRANEYGPEAVVIREGEKTTITYLSEWVAGHAVKNPRYVRHMSLALAERLYDLLVWKRPWKGRGVVNSDVGDIERISTYKTLDDYVRMLSDGRIIDSLGAAFDYSGSTERGWMILYVTDVEFSNGLVDDIYIDYGRNIFFVMFYSPELGKYVAVEGRFSFIRDDEPVIRDVLLETTKSIGKDMAVQYAEKVLGRLKNYPAN